MTFQSSSVYGFCSSTPIYIRSQSLSTSTSSIHTRQTHRIERWPRRSRDNKSTTTSNKRPRYCTRHTPVAAFNNGNGNGVGGGGGGQNKNGREKFAKQSAEFIVSTARFLQSPSGQVVLWVGLVWLVLTGRIGFIFDSFLFILALVTIVPVLAVLVFRWWLSRQVVTGTCPSCGAVVTGVKRQAFTCTVCGNKVQGEPSGSFSVKDPTSATIDIDAKQVDDE